MAQAVCYAGIDVGKFRLDAALYNKPGQTTQVAYDRGGLAGLVAWLREHNVVRVGLEASGGYERDVVERLEDEGFTVAVLDPRRVRNFAKAKGRFAKNDRVDARLIAEFTARMLDRDPARRDRERDVLREHLLMRRRLLRWMGDCDSALEHLRDPALRKTLKARRQAFARSLVALDVRIADLVAAEPAWAETAARLRTVPCVGPQLAHAALALLPELGGLSRRAIAALVGVAPFDDESGQRAGAREIDGGRTAMRHALYMAALVGTRHNPVLTGFAKRLTGKPPKVIIVACMRKLITILNAMLRDGKDWTLQTAGKRPAPG